MSSEGVWSFIFFCWVLFLIYVVFERRKGG